MDKSVNEFIAFRRTQIRLQMQSMADELTFIEKLEQRLSPGDKDVFSDDSEDDQRITESELIEIMKSEKGPWNTRKLMLVSREKNLNIRGLTRPVLRGQINSIILKSSSFKTVRPGYWELADES